MQIEIYKMIAEADSPNLLLGKMTDQLSPLRRRDVKAKLDGLHQKEEMAPKEIPQNYLQFFVDHLYWEEK